MDALERLSLEQIREGSLIACSHVHRYRLAAALCSELRVLDLCCGSGYGSLILAEQAQSVLGVDLDAEAMEAARREAGERDDVGFERGDALDLLAGQLDDRFDAIVILEGVEHLADPDRALAALRAHAERGMRLVVSLPNGKAFREHNPYHVIDYDFEEATEAFAGFPRLTLLYQFNAEGSLIRPAGADPKEGVDSHPTLLERAEPEYCNHVLALSNFDSARDLDAVATLMRLDVAPLHNRYIVDLERANRELWAANARLSRDWLGRTDSAAAARLAALERRATLAALAERYLGRRYPAFLRIVRGIGRWVPVPLRESLRRLRSRG